MKLQVQAGWLHDHRDANGAACVVCAVVAHGREAFHACADFEQAYERPLLLCWLEAGLLVPYSPLATNARARIWQRCYAKSAAPWHLLAGGINQTMAKKSPKKPTKAKAAAKKKSPAKHRSGVPA